MHIYLIGIGMGNPESLTIEAGKAIRDADVLIGAARMTEPFREEKKVYHDYKAEEIVKVLQVQESTSKIAILMSGDVGFYSGAKKLIKAIEKASFYKESEFTVLPGISSVVSFCAKLHMSWDDVKLISVHGREANLVGYVRRFPKVFALMYGREQLSDFVERLREYDMGYVKIHVGQKLSYPDESVFTIIPDEIGDIPNIDPLYVVLIENDKACDDSLYGISDDEFIRTKIPMTKSDVRTLSIAKLELKPDSVLFDIGAGTGSISIEASRKLIDGRVYAIERKTEAIELINKNIRKFAADNVSPVEGKAPLVLKKLPVPTHAFIGGSGGNMEKIIDFLLAENPDIRIVINATALNTIGEVSEIIRKREWEADITSVSIAKSREIGGYQMMTAQNPVYIIALEPGKKH